MTDDDAMDRLRELTEGLIGPELMSAWLEDLPVAFLVVNHQGKIVYFNLAAELLFEYSRQEVLGHAVEILVPEAARSAHVNHRGAYSEEPRKRAMGSHLELKARKKGGAEFQVEISLAPRMTVAGLMTSAVVWQTKIQDAVTTAAHQRTQGGGV